jgi:3D (Asp-Asp-Asp) domain-containing protein
LYVEGYGVGVAADTGAPRSYRLWIDLGYDDASWINWHRYVDVYLLTPVPQNIVYMLPDK